MKSLSAFLDTVSITSVTRYIIMTIALSMIFVSINDTALGARIARAFHIRLELMGGIIAAGVIVSIIARAKWIRLLGILPYGLFFVGVVIVAIQQSISLHLVLIYLGYGIQLLFTLRNGNNHAP